MEKINIAELLKSCPKRTKLYSTVWGDVYLNKINDATKYPISVTSVDNSTRHSLTSDGRLWANYKGECLLFPSKDQRDWSKFKSKKERFDPKTLKPFDRVLVRDYSDEVWNCSILSHKQQRGMYNYTCTNGANWKYCIPYNDDTKHLVGINEEAPEYYRYWED